jgi:hypothetical protein
MKRAAGPGMRTVKVFISFCVFKVWHPRVMVHSAPGHQLEITTSSLSNGTVGETYSAQIAATGGITPYTYSASGLPGGLSILRWQAEFQALRCKAQWGPQRSR